MLSFNWSIVNWKTISHEKIHNRLSIILWTIKQIVNQSLKSWSIHHGIDHFSEKKNEAKKILEAKFEARPIFWGQAKIWVEAKIEAKNEARPTLGPGQGQWGQARFYSIPLQWRSLIHHVEKQLLQVKKPNTEILIDRLIDWLVFNSELAIIKTFNTEIKFLNVPKNAKHCFHISLSLISSERLWNFFLLKSENKYLCASYLFPSICTFCHLYVYKTVYKLSLFETIHVLNYWILKFRSAWWSTLEPIIQ